MLHIVSIADDSVASKGFEPALVELHVVLQHGRAGLSEPIHIHNDAEIVQLVMSGHLMRLPVSAGPNKR